MEEEDLQTVILDEDERSAAAIELSSMGATATVDLREVGTGSIGQFLNALPLPSCVVDETYTILFANEFMRKFRKADDEMVGYPFYILFPDRTKFGRIRGLLDTVFYKRKPQVTEVVLQMNGKRLWGRMHLRSVRLWHDSDDRAILVLIEDLTHEKMQLAVNKRHEVELRRTHELLEKRVRERTVELHSTNEQLLAEVAQRKQAEWKLRSSVRRLEKTLDGTVSALAAMAEKRDPYNAGHQRRVARLAGAVAEQMGLSEDRTGGIIIAASMHDIGKISVPAELLSKPGRINEHEYGIIKAHAMVGYDILKEIDFPWPLADVVLQHHERMNGSGYPQRLKGNNILLEARIVAVADVVEAISSHRPYRPAIGSDHAIDEIKFNRGHLYDPDVVDACLSALESGFEFE